MYYCEKHRTINISSFGCGLCSQEKAEQRKQQLERCEKTLTLVEEWFVLHVPDFMNYDIFKEIQGALHQADQDKEDL